jgi:phosphatidylserine/phosphatidylglycerophosphate/cardiolipin synthase-like enzyme
VVPAYTWPERVAALRHDATDPARVQATLVAPALLVGAAQFIADGPDKHTAPAGTRPDAWAGLRAELSAAQQRVLLQTPYLVLPPNLHALFASLQQRPQPPQVEVLTNSLAATDIWPAYALTYRHRQRLMRELRFELHEYKPFPADAPFDLASTSASVPASALALHFAPDPVPSPRAAGVRIGLHAKALVIDDRLGVIGSHNFDHRGERFNIESAVLIEDRGFAAALTASIRRDMAPDNAWRVSAAATSAPTAELGGWLSRFPLLDLWPFRYGSSYEFQPGPQCPQPPPAAHPDFARCHARVGDFPDAGFVIRGLTRVLTSVGAGLAPLL